MGFHVLRVWWEVRPSQRKPNARTPESRFSIPPRRTKIGSEIRGEVWKVKHIFLVTFFDRGKQNNTDKAKLSEDWGNWGLEKRDSTVVFYLISIYLYPIGPQHTANPCWHRLNCDSVSTGWTYECRDEVIS